MYEYENEWAEIEQDINDCYTLFKDIKKRLKNFYRALEFENFKELAGERQPIIIRKLFKYEGDITPSMLMTLVKEVKQNGFLKS